MSQTKQSILTIPHFVKAKSPESLRRKMFDNNVKNKKLYSYFDIQYVSGVWYAWYYEEQNFLTSQRDTNGDKQESS